jgi:parallel beta-helix repeat protein
MKPFRCQLVVIFWILQLFQAAATVLFVDLNSPNPTPPYTNLTIAATSIQDAVNAATNGDLILVNDGFYQDGYQTTPPLGLSEYYDTNRVVVSKPVTVQSLNGPSAAYISGGGIYRCVYLTNGAALNGFTLMSGAAGWVQTIMGRLKESVLADGGGVTGSKFGGGVVSNCVLSGNSATGNGGGAYGTTLINCVLSDNTATNGGGAAASTLLNCTVTGNSVQFPSGSPEPPGLPATCGGGGIYEGSAINCLIADNSAYQGGGAWGAVSLINCTIINNSAAYCGGICPNIVCQVTNCIIYFNSADTNANYGTGNLSIGYSCTMPLPDGGSGNITNEPTFVDFWGGDYHLASDCPVINAGNNAFVTNSTDLDGNPRIVGGTVDMGAYEFQTPASVLSYAWALQYGLPTDGTADFVDSDGDGMNNWQEWIAGTNPTNAASVLTMSSPVTSPISKSVSVSWQSVTGKTYFLQRSTNLYSPAGFSTIQSNLTGQAGTTSFTDTTATNGNSFFYRVGVQ